MSDAVALVYGAVRPPPRTGSGGRFVASDMPRCALAARVEQQARGIFPHEYYEDGVDRLPRAEAYVRPKKRLRRGSGFALARKQPAEAAGVFRTGRSARTRDCIRPRPGIALAGSGDRRPPFRLVGRDKSLR